MTPEEIENQKRVEFYAASVTAWFNTSLEHDKSLLALSAGGIGLLLTLLTTVGLTSAEALVLYVCAIVSFVVALVTVLVVFRRNRNYIEDVLSGKATSNDPLLTKLDKTASWAFGIGALFTAVIGIAAAVNSYSIKVKSMAHEAPKKTETVPLRESFNGAGKLQPTVEATKSFDGVVSLQPKPAAAPATPAVPAAPAGSTPAPAPSTSTGTQKGGSGK